jgi:hypothetical protein
VLEPERIVTDVSGEPPELEANTPPVDVDERLTVVLPIDCTMLPYVSCSWTVTAPRVALEDAGPVTGPVTKPS